MTARLGIAAIRKHGPTVTRYAIVSQSGSAPPHPFTRLCDARSGTRVTPEQDPHTPAIDLLCLSAHTLGQVVMYSPPTNAAPDFRKGRARTGADPREGGR